MKNVIKNIIPVICLIPLAIGTTGYLISGEMITDSLYASFALYFTNPVSDAYNVYIEIARWTAPLVTISAVLCILRNVWNSIRWRLSLFCRNDSVAIYSDKDIRIQFNKGTKAIYPGDVLKEYAKNHIIMFSSDQKNLQFYEKYKKQLDKKTVYIGLRDLDLGLVREINNVTLFDINGSISRILWKDIALWKTGKEKMDIVIYGSNKLSQEILATGLQLNLLSRNQYIKYHFISDNQLFQIKHQNMPLVNNDEIYYYKTDDGRIWDIISNADIVVVAEQIQIEVLQAIIVRAGGKSIYYYSPEETSAGDYISFKKMIPFGKNTILFTDENIRQQKLVSAAIELNRQYAEKYNAEKNWNNLSGFLKASNISLADFGEVVDSLIPTVPDEELVELEHIRWCRFHYLNYWKYGVPGNAENKDTERRIHKDLVAYGQLDKEEKEKDMATIKTLREKCKNRHFS